VLDNRRKVLIHILLVLGVMLSVGAVLTLILLNSATASLGNWLSYDGGCLGSEPYSNQVIEQMGRFELPNSAQHINATSEAFQDCFIFVSFEMDVADFEAFPATTHISSPLVFTNHLTGFDNLPLELNWNFETGKNYLYGRGSNGSQEYQSIAVDTENPSTYTVYIITALL
jgi:hypothetical protein